MPDTILLSIEFGGYISIVKLVIFLLIFFAWIPLFGWVYRDALQVGTNEKLWSFVVLAGGAIGALLCLLIGVFFVGAAFFIIAVGASVLSYVMHRNALVPEYDKVGTIEHFMSLFENEGKKLEELESLRFITANDNEVPTPEPKSEIFIGFRVAHSMFTDAVYKRATNIILNPVSNEYKVSYIVDGASLGQPEIPREKVEAMLDFLKEVSGLDREEKRKPQKGQFRVATDDGSSQWAIRTAGSTVGEQVKLKQVTQDQVIAITELGLMPEQLGELNRIKEIPQGLFLVSGPPKSGVTTTFYSLLRQHDAFLNSITTLEINPTAELPNVTQQVYSLSDSSTKTYDQKLTSIIRMSPDVLGVVDLKDAETAKNAFIAAKDGATVYATIEADSVTSAVGKLIRLVGDRKLIAEYLIGASNQRLYRLLCGECKQAYTPNQELFRKFNIQPGKAAALYRESGEVFDKRGKGSPCGSCHEIGFYGRACVFETVMINEELKTAIVQAKSVQDLGTQFRKAKMKFIQEQMLQKVLDGTTSINELIRICSGPQAKTKPSTK